MVVDVFLTKAVDETEVGKYRCSLQDRVDEQHEPQSQSSFGNDETACNILGLFAFANTFAVM